MSISTPLQIAEQKRKMLQAQLQAERLQTAVSTCLPPHHQTSPKTAVSSQFPDAADNDLRNEGAVAPAAAPSPSWAMRNAIKQVNSIQEMRGIKPGQRQTAVDNAWIADLAQTAVFASTQNTASEVVETAVSMPLTIDDCQNVKVWPALASALHQAGYAPHNRLYTAVQLLDPDRSGCIDARAIRVQFTDKSNGRYLFGWRRVRQILNSGDGILWNWNRANDCIHLRGPRRIAEALEVERVDKAVMVPVSILLTGQGHFNAHIHAAWLAAHGDESKPISQAAIKTATAVPERTQRHYNRVAGVQRHKNFELGVRHTELSKEEAAWQHGHNSFEFVDYHGRHGKSNGRYRARRLPDSYHRRHCLAAKGRQRKINRALARLVNMETRGSTSTPLIKLYHTNGRSAVQAHSKQPDIPAYWPENGRAGISVIWYVLS